MMRTYRVTYTFEIDADSDNKALKRATEIAEHLGGPIGPSDTLVTVHVKPKGVTP